MSIIVDHTSRPVASNNADAMLQAAVATMYQEADRIGVVVRLYPDRARRYNESGIQLVVVPADFNGSRAPLRAQVKAFRALEASWNERAPERDLTVRLDYVWNPEAGG